MASQDRMKAAIHSRFVKKGGGGICDNFDFAREAKECGTVYDMGGMGCNDVGWLRVYLHGKYVLPKHSPPLHST